MTAKPILLWLRRDFRLTDHAALHAAAATGRPVIPVFILDAQTRAIGVAPRWRLSRAIAAFEARLQGIGSGLVLRAGEAADVLRDLVAETGADTVYWSRWYEPKAVARDTQVKAQLKDAGITAESFAGFLLFEPWAVETGQGKPYSVYSPFWRAVHQRPVAAPLDAVGFLVAPGTWPRSEALASWGLEDEMRRGAAVVAKYAAVGETAALARLQRFCDEAADGYKQDRNRPDMEATSRLSENLTYGEISPRTVWHRGQDAMRAGQAGAEHFLKELVWREFAWHLMWHAPDMDTQNWRDKWDAFPWSGESAASEAWCRGETGVDMVDAGMRELYATGTMHNRVRMVVASYLTKHMLVDWRVGRAWFEDTLIDWDPASNAMGWQWVAGCGPDAAPYFRIFNPDTQGETHDPEARYRDMYLRAGEQGCVDFEAAVPQSWHVARPSAPIVDLKAGRDRALQAYQVIKAQAGDG